MNSTSIDVREGRRAISSQRFEGGRSDLGFGNNGETILVSFSLVKEY